MYGSRVSLTVGDTAKIGADYVTTNYDYEPKLRANATEGENSQM
jgi:hypothetical protein